MRLRLEAMCLVVGRGEEAKWNSDMDTTLHLSRLRSRYLVRTIEDLSHMSHILETEPRSRPHPARLTPPAKSGTLFPRTQRRAPAACEDAPYRLVGWSRGGKQGDQRFARSADGTADERARVEGRTEPP